MCATRRQSFRRPNIISMRLRRLYRCLPSLTDRYRDFRPVMHGLIPLCSSASWNYLRHSAGLRPSTWLWARRRARRAASVSSLISPAVMRCSAGGHWIRDGMKLGVHTALGSSDQTPEPLCLPQARCRAAGFERGCVDHDGWGLGAPCRSGRRADALRCGVGGGRRLIGRETPRAGDRDSRGSPYGRLPITPHGRR